MYQLRRIFAFQYLLSRNVILFFVSVVISGSPVFTLIAFFTIVLKPFLCFRSDCSFKHTYLYSDMCMYSDLCIHTCITIRAKHILPGIGPQWRQSHLSNYEFVWYSFVVLFFCWCHFQCGNFHEILEIWFVRFQHITWDSHSYGWKPIEVMRIYISRNRVLYVL
jgi:hypothetical protein